MNDNGSLDISLIIIKSKLPKDLTDTKECKGIIKAVGPRNLEMFHFTKLIVPFIDFSDECHEGNDFVISYRKEIIP